MCFHCNVHLRFQWCYSLRSALSQSASWSADRLIGGLWATKLTFQYLWLSWLPGRNSTLRGCVDWQPWSTLIDSSTTTRVVALCEWIDLWQWSSVAARWWQHGIYKHWQVHVGQCSVEICCIIAVVCSLFARYECIMSKKVTYVNRHSFILFLISLTKLISLLVDFLNVFFYICNRIVGLYLYHQLT